MAEPSQGLSRRDRALAELVRARGWVDEESLQKALPTSEGLGLEDRLVISGSLTPEQARSLRDAVDGVAPDSHTVLRDAPAPLVAIRGRFGPYAIAEELGRGGAAVVYRARHATLGRVVALKVLRDSGLAGEDTLERFRRETAVLARLGRHPGIVQIHEAGREGESLWFAMDLIEGMSLADRLRAKEPMPPRVAAEIAAAAAGALAAAHRAGVVHRDVKPQNILLDTAGRPYVADFGLARDADHASGLTVTGDVFGTPAYMSPEQASGRTREAGAPTDVWSLGVTLYEMLAGRQPFDAPNLQELLRRIVEADPPSIRSTRPEVHDDLQTVCLHALHKDPARRYPTGAEFEADLRRWLAGEPIHARPAGAFERWAGRARRRPAVVAAVALALVAAGAALGWAGWKSRAAGIDKEQRQKVAEAREARLSRARAEGEDLLKSAEQARRLGELGERDRWLAEAVARLSSAIAADGPDAEVRVLLGRALRLSGRPEEALGEFDAAIALTGGHARASWEHGLIMQRRLFECLDEWGSRARTGTASSSVYENLVLPVRLSDDARRLPESELRRIVARDFGAIGGKEVNADLRLFGEAMIAMVEDRADDALGKLNLAIEANANFEEALVAAADLEFWRRNHESALGYRRQVLAQQPHNPVARLEYAAFLAETGGGLFKPEGALAQAKVLDEAKLEAKSALERVENHPDCLLLAVNVAMIVRDRDGAAALARRLAAAANTPELRRAAAIATVAALAMHDPRTGLETLAGLEADFAPDEVAAVRFTLLNRLHRAAEALAVWRMLDKGPMEDKGWLRDKRLKEGILLETHAGNIARAAALADELVKIDPRGALILRSAVLLEGGRTADACAEFERSFKYEETGGDTDFLTSRLSWHAGRFGQALGTISDTMGSLTPRGESPTGASAWIRTALGTLTDESTPREAAAAMEKLIGLARLMVGADRSRPEIMEGLWYPLALLYALMQDWRYAQGWAEESLRDGEHYVRLYPCGLGYLRQARALASLGKGDEAMAMLNRAIELGLQESSALEGERAFDSLRTRPDFEQVRAKLR